MCSSSACFTKMTHNFFRSHFYWCLIWFTLLLSQSTKLLSNAASPSPESSQPDAASRVPCDGTDHLSWSNSDMPSLDTAMQFLPLRATSAAQTCNVEEEACRTIRFPEASPSRCGHGVETLSLKGSQQPNSGDAMQPHIKLPQQACHFNPNPAATSVPQDHGNMPSPPVGHIDAGVVEAELRKGRKPPTPGTPSPHHNSIPKSETFDQVDVSLKEPTSGGHGQETAANSGHDGNSFVRISDSSDSHTVLARSSSRPGTGTPSKGHNRVTDRVASE